MMNDDRFHTLETLVFVSESVIATASNLGELESPSVRMMAESGCVPISMIARRMRVSQTVAERDILWLVAHEYAAWHPQTDMLPQKYYIPTPSGYEYLDKNLAELEHSRPGISPALRNWVFFFVGVIILSLFYWLVVS